MKVDLLSVLPYVPSRVLVQRIAEFSVELAGVVASEVTLEERISAFPAALNNTPLMAEVQEALRKVKEARAEAMVDLITMVNEYNSREDCIIPLPLSEGIYNLLEA